jgi:HSP20 family molecular chaperone IbpA
MSQKEKQKNNRVSIPSKIKELLFYDDQFFRDVIELNKIKINNNFPKQDQWCDEEGIFHIEFALAGYSPSDIEIVIENDEFTVKTIKSIKAEDLETEEQESDKKITPKPKIQHGVISRGIARRNFSYGLVLSQEYDIYSMSAEMENGLLHISVPKKEKIERKVITLLPKKGDEK